MSRAARRRQSHGLHIFLTVILVILTACVVVKAFFLKAPEQKAAGVARLSARRGGKQPFR